MNNIYQIGDTVIYVCDEFDGRTMTVAKITEIHDDYIICVTDMGYTLWLDI